MSNKKTAENNYPDFCFLSPSADLTLLSTHSVVSMSGQKRPPSFCCHAHSFPKRAYPAPAGPQGLGADKCTVQRSRGCLGELMRGNYLLWELSTADPTEGCEAQGAQLGLPDLPRMGASGRQSRLWQKANPKLHARCRYPIHGLWGRQCALHPSSGSCLGLAKLCSVTVPSSLQAAPRAPRWGWSPLSDGSCRGLRCW